MSDGGPIAVGTRVSFPYGGSRRTGTVADVSMIPDQSGGQSLAYLIDVGSRKVFVQGELWNAHAPSRVGIGEQVVVRKVEGLELEVEKSGN